ncbi:CPBP family intramembrane glutamic endopeptidase [Acetivibrio cellulolyticus]|uniref:CPBP family intramembrane glutamic endopeptidase n=1 Tax=Acetivibrio cellulolyticus TaxID=35830 RepID=UPI0001E2E2E2|nr:CPBP family intramembrane glutamic endopeptidase [Acetivibrio cellulolyticus]
MRGYVSKKLVIEILFILPFAILPAFLEYYGGLVALILMPLSLLLRENIEGNYEIYNDKKLLFNFIIVYSILLMYVFFTAFGLYKSLGFNDEYVKNIIKIICLTLSLILLKISRVSIKNFKWNVCRSHILGTLTIALMYACITIFFDGFIFINRFNGDIVNYGFFILKTVILVAFFEEFLCRGILISALKGYQIAEWKANIMQALLFGILHCVKNI